MILVWNDVKSFKRHLENMRRFRQGHQAISECVWNLLKDMPVPDDIQLQDNAGGVNRLFSSSGRTTTFPIWEIGLPIGSQN